MKRSTAYPALAVTICLFSLADADAAVLPYWQINQQANTGFKTIIGMAPALASVNSTPYMAWTAACPTAGKNCIYYSSFNGSTWTAKQQHPQAQTGVAPALAGYNGQLYLAWAGESSHEIFYSSFNGSTWTPQSKVVLAGGAAATTFEAPALSAAIDAGSYGDPLYLAWTNTSSGISYATFKTAWSAATEIPNIPSGGVPAPVGGPALLAMNTSELVAWTSSPDLWSATLAGAVTPFNPPLPVPNPGPESSLCPGLVATTSAGVPGAYMAWANGNGYSPIWFSSLSGGTPPTGYGPVEIAGEGWVAEAAAAPAMAYAAVTYDTLGIYLAWSGSSGNIWYTTLTLVTPPINPHCPCPTCCT